MLLKSLREEVVEANLELVQRGLVLYTFGNASGIDRERNLVGIKPSGVPYERLTAQDIVITDLNGVRIDGTLRPSSDLDTHLELYLGFPAIGGVVHTHSEFATAWAQTTQPIPCFGTTHADYFFGEIPVTAPLQSDEIAVDYEKHTGAAIRRRFAELDPQSMPAVLVAGHGPFTWGASAADAAHHAVILESIARMAYYTGNLSASATPISNELLNKHFLRKHGKTAYYGQGASI